MSNNIQVIPGKGDSQWRMLTNWMAQNGFNEPCCELHPNTSCSHQVGLKFVNVARNNNLLYMAIHFLPFLIFKVRTLGKKSKSQIALALLKLMKRYIGSILFMSSFVAGYRAVLCLRGNIGGTSISPWFLLCSTVGSLALFFEDKSRRAEVALYAFVRSIPTAYNILSRRGYINIPHVDKLVFVTLFGLLSLCYHSYNENLNYASIFEKIWGKE